MKAFRSENRENSLADPREVFGFTGWAFYQSWRAAALFLPASPLFSYLFDSWAITALFIAIMIAPYAISCVVSDAISSVKTLKLLSFALWIVIAAGIIAYIIAPENAVLQLILISAAMWLMNITWQPYFSNRGSFIIIGFRSIITAGLFLVLFLSQLASQMLVVWIYAAIAAVFIVFYLIPVDDDTWEFVKKADSQSGTEPDTYSGLWYFGQALVFGIGAGCIISSLSGDSTQTAGVLAISQLLAGIAALLLGRFSSDPDKHVYMFVVILVSLPLMIFVSFIPTPFGCVVGALLFMASTIKAPFASATRGPKLSFEKKSIDLYSNSKGFLYEMSGLLVGTVGAIIVDSGNLGIMAQVGFYVAVLAYLIIAWMVQTLVLFTRYDYFFEPEADSVPEPETESEIWEKKLEQVCRKYDLSARQADVLRIMAQGKSQEDVAKELYISRGTVRTHAYYIYKKLHVHAQSELIDLVANTTLP